MKGNLLALLLLLPFFGNAQQLVYTVAGNDTSTAVTPGDGGPATAALIGPTEGIWIDGNCNCNLYISDLGNSRIRKVDGTTGIITTIAGTTLGYAGDGGPATNAKLRAPYGLYIDNSGDIYFADRSNYRIRKINAATGVISTFAGGGSSLGDGGPATNAQLIDPPSVYGDDAGNFYIGDKDRIRRVDGSTGIITTIAGNGTYGLSGDGGAATSAQIYYASGMLFDASGNLIFADRGNARIRKINFLTGVITTIAGTTAGFSGDGGPATAAQFEGPISFVIDNLGNIIIGDNGNDVIREIDAVTGKINTIAGVGTSVAGSNAEGVPATTASIHPEFLYLDLHGNLYYSNYSLQVRKIINFEPGLSASGSRCGPAPSGVPEVSQLTSTLDFYPNPAYSTLTIQAGNTIGKIAITNILGQLVNETYTNAGKTDIDVGKLPSGLYFVKINGIYAGKFIKE